MHNCSGELQARFNPEGSDLRRMQHRMTEMLRVIDGILSSPRLALLAVFRHPARCGAA